MKSNFMQSTKYDFFIKTNKEMLC